MSISRAILSPCLILCANSTSSSALISSTLPISCKYLSRDAVSLFVTCLVIFNCLIFEILEPRAKSQEPRAFYRSLLKAHCSKLINFSCFCVLVYRLFCRLCFRYVDVLVFLHNLLVLATKLFLKDVTCQSFVLFQ